jgi:hypothetical protein
MASCGLALSLLAGGLAPAAMAAQVTDLRGRTVTVPDQVR